MRIVESKDPVVSAPASTHFANIGSEKIAYGEIDNHASTTVVFVGGLSAWNGTWERVMTAANMIDPHFNYVAIDLPPFGYSIPDKRKNYFRDTQAERIAAFIDVKHIEHVILVGHSYGGGPVTEYAMRHKNKVTKIVLVDAVLNVDEQKNVSTFSPIQLGVLRTTLLGAVIHIRPFAISQLKSFVFITDHVDDALLDIYTRYTNTKGATSRLSKWLLDYMNDPLGYDSTKSEKYKALSMPVRIIWGEEDTITPISGTKILLDSIPNVSLQILHGVGHIPMIEDHLLFDNALSESLKN